MFVIVNENRVGKLYLSKLEKSYCSDWEVDGFGKTIRKVERVPVKERGRDKGLITTGHYLPDPERAMTFKTFAAAEKKIRENPVLRFCRVEEVNPG